jgi:hypothetical protein
MRASLAAPQQEQKMSLILFSTLLAISVLYAVWLLEERRDGRGAPRAWQNLRMGRGAVNAGVRTARP